MLNSLINLKIKYKFLILNIKKKMGRGRGGLSVGNRNIIYILVRNLN